MKQKTIAIAVVLMAAVLAGLFATSPLAYAEDNGRDHDGDNGRDHDGDNGRDHDGDKGGDKGGDESTTSTDQKLKQENVGSGDAEQNNCAEQLIKAGADRNCRFIN